MVLQPDGKLLLGGPSACGCLALLRLNLDGMPDTSFGSNGQVLAALPAPDNGYVSAVTLQPDGKIVAGVTFEGESLSARSFALARFEANGRPDSTFGSNGWAFSAPWFNVYLSELIAQPDGKILAAGGYTFAVNASRVERFLPNGDLDADWSTDLTAGANPAATAAALQLDGKSVIIGNHGVGCCFSYISRRQENGKVDGSFSGGGYELLHYGSNAPTDSYASAIVIQPDGKILVGGGKGGLGVTRFTNTGQTDTSFADQGHFRRAGSPVAALALQPDGRILVSFGGNFYPFSNFGQSFSLLRLTANGQLDSAFATDGIFQPNGLPMLLTGEKLILQPDGKILIAGNRSDLAQRITVARYEYAPVTSIHTPEAPSLQLAIYPNPATLHITCALPGGHNLPQELPVWITNQKGQTIQGQRIGGNRVDVSALSPGLYFVHGWLAGHLVRGGFIKI
jgi:hypothetical protein